MVQPVDMGFNRGDIIKKYDSGSLTWLNCLGWMGSMSYTHDVHAYAHVMSILMP